MLSSEKPGKKLELLVASLERVLAGTGAKIESPSRRLRDRDTGRAREHDVLIIWDHAHHRIVTAIECRDRSRPVGVPDVEAFSDKCNATGVNSGVIVSATGFRDSARSKAAARSITCMDLTEVEGFDWLATDFSVVSYRREFGQVAARIMFKGEQPAEIGIFIDESGGEYSGDQLKSIIINSIPHDEGLDEVVEGATPTRIKFKTPTLSMRDSAGRVWSIDHILIETTITIKKIVSKGSAHRYSGGGKDYAVATADVHAGKLQGKVVIVRNEDETTSVYLTFAPDVKSPL